MNKAIFLMPTNRLPKPNAHRMERCLNRQCRIVLTKKEIRRRYMKNLIYNNLQAMLLLCGLMISGFSIAQESGCTNGDCENGKGRYIFPNGDKYIGEFKAAQLDGRGVYTFKNGNVYQGQFKDNMRHGYGTYKWINGDTYIGEYVKNEREGEGAYYYADGKLEKGTFKKGQFVPPVVQIGLF